MDNIVEYSNYLTSIKVNNFIDAGYLFREYGSIIIPFGPVANINNKQIVNKKSVYKHLRGKLLWWSYIDNNNTIGENTWYGVVKSGYTKVDEYNNAKTRNQIRKGLKNCIVNKISATNLLDNNGYKLYKNVISSYNLQPMCETDFINFINAGNEYCNIVDYWGVFIDNELIGYSIVYKYGNYEANISEVRLLPSKKQFYPSYALFHELNKYYLNHSGFKYLSDGYRSVMHKTNIQHFLISKFGFYKIPLRLNLEVKWPYNILSWLVFIRWLPGLPSKIKTVLKLYDIIKTQKPV